MQDDPHSPAPLDPQPPASNDHMNRDGVTNGVPDGAGEGESKARPHDDRGQAETAPGAVGPGQGDDPAGQGS